MPVIWKVHVLCKTRLIFPRINGPIISLFPVGKVRVETDIKESHLSETLKNA